jgi:2-polyprenyl-6-methoxyphenol hydroxylase-like FAD-dependent oxidoreductase
MSKRRSSHDVIVVGARCAGAATAMLLARYGHDVVVVDRARFPSDTLSTHGILHSGVVQLSRWGLLDDVRSAVAGSANRYPPDSEPTTPESTASPSSRSAARTS